MENNEVMVEAVEEFVDSGKGGAKGALVVAGSAIVGALLWNRVIKPVGRKIKAKLNSSKTETKNNELTVESDFVDRD